ncbi:FxSxx-COOH cyclophane-containing RiPP peptide [Streptomyces fumanus]|uniref:FXSXX-COOH protein n=1 Tax=Streptomyces fumanus TaxID=67302 RepID=A0A919E6N4_9ACTN|nr:FxSxx-COOH cyclophane-containing RiPP peptide [Streptomyces fumanus]GHF19322.1 FXSXX-COOH protein [Streptomyces fumanus]
MDAAYEPADGPGSTGAAEQRPEPPPEPLPDLLALDLDRLGTIEHPVLREVLQELRTRAAEPSEMMWGFDNSF